MSKPKRPHIEKTTASSKSRKKRPSSKGSALKDLTLDSDRQGTNSVKSGVKDSHDRYG
jgi:hypothetical protein